MTSGGARDPVGLCRLCRHARPVETPRSLFWLCQRSADDPAFPRYPRLPVRECRGFEPTEATGSPPGDASRGDPRR
jgi:hypothetical protein